MTVSSQTSKVSYSGNGSTVAFTVTFYFLANSDIKVLVRSANGTEVVKTLDTDYTITGAGDPAGGTVTFTTAPISGETVVLARSVPLTQVTDYTPNDPFPAETHERALDKLTQLSQQINEAVNRSLKLSLSNTMTSTEFTVDAATRANKILGFDASGELSVTQELGTYRGNWSAGTDFVPRDIIKDTSNANIYICLTAHTSTGSQPISSNTDSAKWALLVDAASATAAQAAAEAAQAAAETAQAAAELAETNAETAETNAETAETNAETAATNASNSASAAATSATNASNSATAAATSATNASNSATAAANSATAAQTAETNAETAEANAETAQAAAEAAQLAAETAETNAETAETNAETAATNASNSAIAAAASATDAETAQTAAETAQAGAEAALEAFNETYLGAKSSDPSVDNNGDPVTAGDWYFNTTTSRSRIYTGSAWENVIVDTTTVVAKTGNTGSAVLPVGSTAERDASPQSGFLRFNTSTGAPEIYNGSAWGSVGGGATGAGGDTVFQENSRVVTTNYTLTANKSASCVGPITVNSGVSLTIPSGERLVIL